EMYANGFGLKAIARILTAERVMSPQGSRRTDGLDPWVGWNPSTVNGMLRREDYHCVGVWNKTRKRNDFMKWDPSKRGADQWVRVQLDETLRIIDEPLWKRVQARRREIAAVATRFDNGYLCGRPPKHRAVSLLAGLAKCGLCGGGLTVESGGKKRGRVPEYIC